MAVKTANKASIISITQAESTDIDLNEMERNKVLFSGKLYNVHTSEFSVCSNT